MGGGDGGGGTTGKYLARGRTDREQRRLTSNHPASQPVNRSPTNQTASQSLVCTCLPLACFLSSPPTRLLPNTSDRLLSVPNLLGSGLCGLRCSGWLLSSRNGGGIERFKSVLSFLSEDYLAFGAMW